MTTVFSYIFCNSFIEICETKVKCDFLEKFTLKHVYSISSNMVLGLFDNAIEIMLYFLKGWVMFSETSASFTHYTFK